LVNLSKFFFSNLTQKGLADAGPFLLLKIKPQGEYLGVLGFELLLIAIPQ
jgi:hypothetical protein